MIVLKTATSAMVKLSKHGIRLTIIHPTMGIVTTEMILAIYILTYGLMTIPNIIANLSW